MDFSDISRRVGKFAQANAPAILTATGVVGALTTAYLTARATIKAVHVVEREEAAQGQSLSEDEHLPPLEIVRATWTLYIPAATSAAVTIAAIIAANRVSSRRAASVATALAIGETAFREYKDKVTAKIGEGKERSVRDDIAQDHVRANPPEDRLVIITDGGHVLCRDEYSGRYFKSSVEEIRKAENTLNKRIINEGDVSLSDFYDLIGIPRTSHSDDVGWNTDEFINIDFVGTITQDDKPCICVVFDVAPFPAFFKNTR